MIMTLRGILLSFWLVLSSFSIDHGIYITVFDIHHDATTREGKVVIKSFSDDLTNALRSMNFNIPADANPCGQNESLESYIDHHVDLLINDQKVALELADCTIENDTHWITLTYEANKPLSRVEVITDWMTELFGNQQNIIKVKSDGEVKSLRLSREKERGTLSDWISR